MLTPSWIRALSALTLTTVVRTEPADIFRGTVITSVARAITAMAMTILVICETTVFPKTKYTWNYTLNRQ